MEPQRHREHGERPKESAQSMSRTLWRQLVPCKVFRSLLPLQGAGWPVHLLANGRLLQSPSSGPPRCGSSRLGEWAGLPPIWGFPGRGTVPRARQFLRTARTRSRPWDLMGGAQSSAPAIFPDRDDGVPPDLANGLGCLRFGDSPGGARSPVPAHAAAQAALESRRPRRLKRLGRRTPAGRGAVLCARYFPGP
jgi:hypothetical protein